MTTRERAQCEPQRDTFCALTGEVIKAGETCWWVRGVGVFTEFPTDEVLEIVLSQGPAEVAQSGGAEPIKDGRTEAGLVEVLEDTVCEITQVRIEKGEGAWFVGGVGYFKKKPTDEDFEALLKDGS